MDTNQSHTEMEKGTLFRDLSDHDKVEDELNKLRKAVEASGEIIFLTDRQGIITYINPEFTRLYGYSAEDVVGKTTPRILKSGKTSAGYYQDFWENLLDKEIAKGEFVNRGKDGRLVTIECSANPILDELGDIVGFLAVQRDITERREAEEELKQRNKELAALNAVAAIVSQSLDLDQILHRTLDEVLRLKIMGELMYGMLFLYDEQSRTLTLRAQRGTPENHPCLSQPIKMGECLCGQAAQRGEVFVSQDSLTDERHTRHWQGMYSHKDISIPVMARGKVLGVMEIRLPGSYAVVENDIEILKSIADQIGVAIENAQLRELRERVIIEERERIARELHDGLSQLLGYVNTKAMAARLLLERRQIKAATQHLLQLEEAARDVFVDVREAISGLKMASQSKASLTVNLNDHLVRFNRQSGLPGELVIPPEVDDLPLKAETKYQLMRIVQEALNNVRKHASASRVRVEVQFADNQLELSIVDDGIGFDLQGIMADDKGYLGLNTMRERALSIGADFTIEPASERGTCVRILLTVGGGAVV